MTRSLFAFVRLTRPHYTVPLSCGLIVILAYVVGGSLSGLGGVALCAAMSLYGVLSASYILNDLSDLRIDTVNRPERMLPQKRISPRTAMTGAALLMLAGMTLAVACGIRFFILMALVAAGLVMYDLHSKRWGLFKNIAAACLTTMLYPLALVLADPADTPRVNVLWIHPIWLFMTTLSYEMLKDIRDVKGDGLTADPRWTRIRTSPAFLLAARLILLVASLLTLLPYVLGYCRALYLFTACAAVGLAAVSFRLSPVKAIPCIYALVFLITAGSLADLWVYGP